MLRRGVGNRAIWQAGKGLVLALPLLVALLAACGGDGPRPRIIVAAASDLRFAFEELEPAYEASCSCEVIFSFGSSGTLATQIAEGLPVDVFVSANTAFIDDLDSKGLVVTDSKQLYAIGRIALAAPAGSQLRLEVLSDLTRPEVRRIAIANPQHAPYGLAARQALQQAGLWEQVEPKLVLGENASLATQYVETKNVEAGIVPLSLAIQRAELLQYVLLDDSLHEPLRQMAAVIRTTKQEAVARGFLEYVNGPEGRQVMRRYGFVLPGELAQQ